MILSAFIEGLSILRPYYEDGDGYHIGAEHDQVYAFATRRPLSDEDVARMVGLGWFQENGADEDGGQYDSEQSWSCFV